MGSPTPAAPQRFQPRRLGFAGRLALATSLLVTVSCAALTWVLTQRASAELSDVAIQRGWTLVHTLAGEAELGVLAGDKGSLRSLCSELLGSQDVVSCSVLDARGTLLVGLGEPLPGWSPRQGDGRARTRVRPVAEGRLWQFEAPVTTADLSAHREELQFGSPDAGPKGGRPAVGRVLVGLSRASVDASQRRLWALAASFASLITLLGVAAAVALARTATRPLKGLAEAAQAISHGHLDASVPVRTNDEIGALGSAFNEMAQSLRQSRKKLFDYNRRLEQAVQARTRELEEANRELKEAVELKSEFLATVSHELRTPLNVIIGYVEILNETAASNLDLEQREMLDAIDRYSRLQLELVTDVLDFSRVSSGRISLDVSRFALEPALADIAALHAESLKQSGLELRLEVAPSVSEVETDRVKLQEIVRNLLDNAIKFTSRGRIEILARSSEDPAIVVIEVRDTGKGISEDDLAHIFDEFRQVGPSSTRSTGGVGLGLAIVRRLAGALGGCVSVESTLGAGSTFTLQLPCCIAGDAAHAEVTAASG
jgi:two-component system, sensor histidine kinase